MKNKILIILVIFILALGISTYNTINISFETKQLEDDNKFLMDRLQINVKDLVFKKACIGAKIKLYSNDTMIINQSNKESYKLVFLYNELASHNDLLNTIRYYSNLIKKNRIIDLKLCYVLWTNTISYAKIVQKRLPPEVEIILDSKMGLYKSVELPASGSGALLLDRNNVCVYSYFIDFSNMLTNEWNSEIIINILHDNEL